MSLQNKGVTLVELLISIAMLGFISVALFTIETFARRQISSSDSRSKLLNQAEIAVSAVAKRMQNSEGSNSRPVFYIAPASSGKDIVIRKQDSGNDPYVILNNDDGNFERFCFDETDKKVYYYSTANMSGNPACGDSSDGDGMQLVAHNITVFKVEPLAATGLYADNYAINIEVQAELIGAKEEATDPNKPKVRIKTTISCPSISPS